MEDFIDKLAKLKNSLNNNFDDTVIKKTELDSAQKLLKALSEYLDDYYKENLSKLITEEVKKQLNQQTNKLNVISNLDNVVKLKENKLRKNGITV